MNVESFRDWPNGWAILYATFAHGGHLYGKVRLNKYLAVLQREGFPVPNKFENKQMGPYDRHIDDEAASLQSAQLLEINKRPSGKPLDLFEYALTVDGAQFVRHAIFPRIDALPFRESYRAIITSTTYLFRSNTEKVVDRLHKDLYLDDKRGFADHLNKTMAEIRRLIGSAEARRSDECELCLDLLGTLDFALRCLEEVRKSHLDDGLTGKHNILFNAERLADDAREAVNHEHMLILDDSSPSNSRLLSEKLKHRLHCLEYNADLYGVVTPIDPSTYEFLEFVVAH